MKDNNKITKCKFFFDLDKELKYINEMNKKGYKLVYIKHGIIYTFIKTNPDEYTTLFYAVEEENQSQITAFVAQYGYESIPHTRDGFGNLLYLTGKKSEVTTDFISDTESKIKFNTIMKKQLSKFVKKYTAMIILFFVCTFLLSGLAFLCDSILLGVISVVYAFGGLFFLVSTIILNKQKNLYKRKLQELQTNSIMYE